MYSVCIVDDEEYIRESILQRLKNSNIPMTAAGMAENGKSALVLYNKTKPDLFFIDIHMPDMSGLDVIEEIRKIDSESKTRFVIISGYDDFIYMQRAIKMGVTDYLKKPIQQDEFEEMLRAVCGIIDMERIKRRTENETSRCYWENFTEESKKNISGSLLLIYKKGIRSFESLKTLTEICPASDWLFLAFHTVSDCVLLFSETKSTEAAEQIVQNMQAQVIVKEGKNLDTREVISLMDMALGERFIRRTPFVKKCDEKMDTYDKTILYELSAALDNTKEERGSRLITELIGQIFKDVQKVHMSSQVFQSIITEISNSYIRHGKPLPGKIREEFLPMALAKYPDIQSVTDILIKYVLNLHQELVSLERKKDVVWKITEYMEKHYEEEISLTSLAEEFFLAPTYLAKCFKDKTGKSVMQYLEEYRMERAQVLLRASDLSISEIALKSGYSDSNYFARSFRKLKGMTPREYRNAQKKQ